MRYIHAMKYYAILIMNMVEYWINMDESHKHNAKQNKIQRSMYFKKYGGN